tara:strand:+ start:5529 stop:6554 length:1026 start_codon:yes stop_codon:yes gene_type:complete
MLKPEHSLIIHFDDQMGKRNGKMGHGVIRFSSNSIVGCVDKDSYGKSVQDVLGYGPHSPVVKDVSESLGLGGNVLVLGMAPSGGRLPPYMFDEVDRAVEGGLSIINGLHEPLTNRYPELQKKQWIWDIRKEPKNLGIASARAAFLRNRRLLMVGTDMAIGKMTSGIKIWEEALERGINAKFLATGQIGICISGSGIALDSIRVDYACGAVEKMVLDNSDAELQIIEGQGSIIHPGSTSTLPLLRGSCPTHLVLCHRAGSNRLADHDIRFPPLSQLISLYEDIASACGGFPKPRTVGIALNTSMLKDSHADDAIARFSQETGLPVVDPLRGSVQFLVDAILE